MDYHSFHEEKIAFSDYTSEYEKNGIDIYYYKCSNPECGFTTVHIVGVGKDFKNKKISFNPISDAKEFPDYIPENIRKDYQEAYSVADYSPKASAVLSRRCLQEILENVFLEPHKSLFKQIEEVKEKVDPDLYEAMDEIREIGNNGAHANYDESDPPMLIEVSQDESIKILKVIELAFITLYTDPHKRKETLAGIKRKAKETPELADKGEKH